MTDNDDIARGTQGNADRPGDPDAAFHTVGSQPEGTEQPDDTSQHPTASYPYPGYRPGDYPAGSYPTAGQPAGYYPQGTNPTAQYPALPGPQPPADGAGWNSVQWYDPNPAYWAPPAPSTAVPAAGSAGRRGRRYVPGIAVAAALAVAAGSVGYSIAQSSQGSSQQTAVTTPSTGQTTTPFGGGSSQGSGGNGSGGTFGDPFGNGSTGSGSSGTTGSATEAQQAGVVDINTVLDYGTAKAAGTGIILSSDGEILTNNHVIDSSTSISVTVVSTGKTYTASVVGTDPTADVAVIKLQGASGLTTANLGDSSTVKVGDAVTAVGNAGGTGGTPSSATGSVVALNQSITASDSDGSNAERLTGMIQTDANIQAGDSGGPLYNASGKVIGIDTAASSTRASTTEGFAIPIATALSVAKQIESGQETATVHIGLPAFLGVQLSSQATGTSGGALVGGVVSGSAAAKAGITAGATITAVGSTSVTSSSDLSTAMTKYNPNDSVKVSWTDSSGQSHTATVTLGSGPAD